AALGGRIYVIGGGARAGFAQTDVVNVLTPEKTWGSGEWGVVPDGAIRVSAAHRRVPLPTPLGCHVPLPTPHAVCKLRPCTTCTRSFGFSYSRPSVSPR